MDILPNILIPHLRLMPIMNCTYPNSQWYYRILIFQFSNIYCSRFYQCRTKLIYCTVKKVTSLHNVLTLDIPVIFSHDKFNQQYFKLQHIHYNLNAADISTKALSGPILAWHWNFLRGQHFYPSNTTLHGQYLIDSHQAYHHLQTTKDIFQFLKLLISIWK